MIDIVGFDLDGVIITDLKFDGKDFVHLNTLRKSCYNIFTPSCDFIIATGRPEVDRSETESWLSAHKINPIKLHMRDRNNIDWTHEQVSIYKADVINSYKNSNYNIKMFIESNLEEVQRIQNLVSIPVYHFSTLINDCIRGKISL